MAGRFSSLRTGAAAVAPARVALRWRPEAGSSPSSMKPGSNFVRVALVGDAASRLYRAARFLRQLEHLPYRQTCQVALCGIPPFGGYCEQETEPNQWKSDYAGIPAHSPGRTSLDSQVIGLETQSVIRRTKADSGKGKSRRTNVWLRWG